MNTFTLTEIFGSEKPSKADIQSKIRQRRSQMLVHSFIYYELDDNIISDDTWQRWANQLRFIQETYPKYCKIKFYDKEFSDWTGDTGAMLPLKDPYVVGKSTYIYELVKKNDRNENT